MLRPGPSARLTIHMAGDAMWRHRPAYAEIVHRAHKQGLTGASVFHGLGYGSHLRIHLERPVRPVAHGPYAVVIVDDEPRLRAFLFTVEDVLATTSGVAILDRVEVHQPAAG